MKTTYKTKEIICDSCGRIEKVEIDYSDMESLRNASKKINNLFRVEGNIHVCNEHCSDVSFSQFNQSF